MRVLRYIVRFLGISALIIWALSSIVYGQNSGDITVNFPQTMDVTGSVSITNLGIDQTVDYDASDVSTQPYVSATGTNSGIDGGHLPTTTYIQSYNSLTVWDGSGSNDGNSISYFHDTLVLKYPVLNWQLLKSDFASLIFGSYISNNTLNPASALPMFYGGRSNMLVYSTRNPSASTITDQIGCGSWSITLDWLDLTGINNNSNTSIFNQSGALFKNLLTYVLTVLMWYEVFYLIVAKVSQA